MSKPVRITNAHQSITFSRRMLLLGGAEAAVGTMLIGRMGWLSIAQNEKYQLLSESNRVQLIPVPPRRGWLIDRNGKPIAINKASFRIDIIPQQMVKGQDIVSEVAKLIQLPPTRSSGSTASLRSRAASSRCRWPTTCHTINMRRSRYAFRSFPESPLRAASHASTPRLRLSVSWSAMSERLRSRNMKRRTGTRCFDSWGEDRQGRA